MLLQEHLSIWPPAIPDPRERHRTVPVPVTLRRADATTTTPVLDRSAHLPHRRDTLAGLPVRAISKPPWQDEGLL